MERKLKDLFKEPDVKGYNQNFFNNLENKSNSSTDSTYVQTTSGLKYVVVKEGAGVSPKENNKVTLHYTELLPDGTVCQSSMKREKTMMLPDGSYEEEPLISSEPITYPVKSVIEGWKEGLQLMKEGGIYVLYVPSELAYGNDGVRGIVPPNSPLIYKIYLIKVE